MYIIATDATASASELVINCLKPYINVTLIGETTVGKNVGSVTLYDSPTFAKKDVNGSHRYAMQPIVIRTVNKDGFGEYSNGIAPTIEHKEDIGNMGVIGNATNHYLQKLLPRLPEPEADLPEEKNRLKILKALKTLKICADLVQKCI